MPTRFAKQLALIFRGALAIGIDRPAALALALRCARGSIPPIRLSVLRDLADHDADDCRVADVAKRLRKPWRTTQRTLDALWVLELANRIEVDDEDEADNDDSKKTDRKTLHYAIAATVDLSVLD